MPKQTPRASWDSHGVYVVESANLKLKQLKKQAEAGNVGAAHNLGNAYEDGDGVTANYLEAVNWWKLAAVGGHVGARYKVAIYYENNSVHKIDQTEAMKWYILAAQADIAIAQCKVGQSYLTGTHGVAIDKFKAVKW